MSAERERAFIELLVDGEHELYLTNAEFHAWVNVTAAVLIDASALVAKTTCERDAVRAEMAAGF